MVAMSPWEAKIQSEIRKDIDRTAEKIKARAREREKIIAVRKASGTHRPDEYVPPMSLEQLQTAVDAGQYYLEGCVIKGSETSPVIIHLDLAGTNLARAEFYHVRFSKSADLSEADLSDCILHDVAFADGCRLIATNFNNARRIEKLKVAQGAIIKRASFQFAKFHSKPDIAFDENNILNAVFYARRSDSWTKLSSAYSAIRQIIYIFLFALYVAPILFKVYLFQAVASSDELMTILGAVGEARTNGEYGENTVTVWQIVFGESMSSILAVSLFIVFHVARAYITMAISPLIDSERQTGYTPAKESYQPLIKLNNGVRVLLLIVLALIFWDLYLITRLKIVLP